MEHSQDCTSTKETLENLTPLPGLAEWIKSQRDFLANLIRSLEKGKEGMIQETCGPIPFAVYKSYDPNLSFSKMCPESRHHDPALAYAAGLVDGEGHIGIQGRDGCQYSVEVSIAMAMKSLPLLAAMEERFGGTISKRKAKMAKKNWSMTVKWRIGGDSALQFLRLILPYSKLKREQVVLAIRMEEMRIGLNRKWTREAKKEALKMKGRMHLLNKTGPDAQVVGEGWYEAQADLFGFWRPFSETWPRWGMMQNGACWERTKLELHTSGTDGGVLPTLTANTRGGGYGKGDMDLIDAMKTLPTLTASSYGSNQGGAAGREGQKKRPCLDKCLKTLPTLTSSMVTEADFIQAQYHSSKRPKYEDVKKLPTLLATDGSHSGPNQRDSKGRLALAGKLNRLPTLAATDHKSPYSESGYQKQTEKRSKPLRDTAIHEIGIRLSAMFAEWYMGFPLMSTLIRAKGLRGSGTRKSRCKPQWHGRF